MVAAAANKEKDEKRMFVGIAWNCAAELKLFLTALLFLCTLATVLQFLPSRFLLSPSDLRRCLSTPTDLSNSSSAPAPALQNINRDNISSDGVVKRAFNPYGSAAYNFILMSAYRGSPHSFAVVGLSSKPLHIYGKPSYECEWVSGNTSISTAGYKILPDWGYGRVYTVVVVNCSFLSPAVAGGQLLVHAATNGGGGMNSSDTIVALEERAEDYKAEWESAPAYDYLYCGSPLYGNLSPQRVREWMAYHVRLLGANSHFVIHDAGGVHEGLRQVLTPWMEKGFVTLQDMRDQERFDGYYHNQFLVLNDCLHRYRFSAKWIFFFDVDEFVFVPKSTINAVMDSLSEYTQLTMVQMPMSSTLCLSEDAPQRSRKWGFEKLVYKDVKKGTRRDRKYAVQPRNVFATGVHMSQNLVGKTTHNTYGRISYFHYHGTIAQRREPCKQFLNDSQITLDGVPYVMDTTMRQVAGAVKRFELKTIGPVLHTTTQ